MGSFRATFMVVAPGEELDMGSVGRYQPYAYSEYQPEPSEGTDACMSIAARYRRAYHQPLQQQRRSGLRPIWWAYDSTYDSGKDGAAWIWLRTESGLLPGWRRLSAGRQKMKIEAPTLFDFMGEKDYGKEQGE